jgi:hypothetical protein
MGLKKNLWSNYMWIYNIFTIAEYSFDKDNESLPKGERFPPLLLLLEGNVSWLLY